MTLGELIDTLGHCPNKDLVLAQGFKYPHSYRGYYDELAVELASNVTIYSMLTAAEVAVDQWYTGWKGGEFLMGRNTVVNLAYEGHTGKELTSHMLDAMLRSAKPADAAEIQVLPEETEDPVEPVNVLFTVNEYDRDGDVSAQGIFLHFGDTRVWVAGDMQGWDKFINQLIDMTPELTDNWREHPHG